MGVRRTVASALGAALLVPVSACSNDGPAPPPLASPTTTAPSASPTESSPSPSGPPTLPPEAQGTSKAAAIAFVRHWVKVFNYAAATGDVAPLRTINQASCVTCEVLEDQIDRVYGDGGFIRGAGWRIRELQYLALQPLRAPVVSVLFSMPPEKVAEAAGAQPKQYGGGQAFYDFRLVFVRQGWRVASLERGD